MAKVEVDEVNLEDLLVLGEDKRIGIEIDFPRDNGESVKVKALIKQLTLKELDGLSVNQGDIVETNLNVLERALFKTNGDNFTREELLLLPIGVVNAVSEKIMEVSGVNNSAGQMLRDF